MALQLCVFNQWFKIEITVFAKIIVSPISIINSILSHVLLAYAVDPIVQRREDSWENSWEDSWVYGLG